MSIMITRNLKLSTTAGECDVAVRIFWPIEQTRAWDCRWEIAWPDHLRANTAHGVDAIQALLHALQMVGTELYCSEEHRAGRLQWRDDWSGYGLPVPATLRDLLIGDDAKQL